MVYRHQSYAHLSSAKVLIAHGADVGEQVATLRERFCELKFCFDVEQFEDVWRKLHIML